MKEWKLGRGTVSFGTAATAAAVCAVLAVIATWAVLDGPAQNVVIDNGSLPDWLAVVATAMVGAGAFKYARATHLQTLDAADAKAEEALQLKLEQVSMARFKLRKLKNPSASVKTLEETGGISAGVVRHAISMAIKQAETIQWSDGDAFRFSEKTMVSFYVTYTTAEMSANRLRNLITQFESSNSPLNEAQKRFFDMFKEIAADLAEVADVIINDASERATFLGEEIGKIQHRRASR